jgi:hypothetical protein
MCAYHTRNAYCIRHDMPEMIRSVAVWCATNRSGVSLRVTMTCFTVCPEANGIAPEIEMPRPDIATLKFTAHQKMQRAPVAIYADFECILEPVQPCSADPKASWTIYTSKHVPCGFGNKLVCADPQRTKPTYAHRGSDAVSKFLEKLVEYETEALDWLDNPVPIVIAKDDEQSFEASAECYICNGAYGEPPVGLYKKRQRDDTRDYVKCRGHDHTDGHYRGAGHHACNLVMRKRCKLPVFFHDLRGYD